jgi:membrane-associated phospholipid phosphatase
LVDHWLDPVLIRFEESVLGFNFTAWLAQFDSPLALDFWMFGYSFYYILAPFAVVVMVWRNEPEIFRRMNIAAAATFFVSYAMFFFFPLEGPRHAMQSVLPPLQGIVFYPLVMKIQNAGAIHGGCMPSSHTAVAWVVTYYIALVDRRIGAALVFISVLLSVGCFWGRFHYLSDVIVGLLIFGVAVRVTERYNRKATSGLHDAPTQEG